MDNIVVESDYEPDCNFSNYSLEELKAEGQRLWEQSTQENPDYYRRLGEWLESKSLKELVKLYGGLATSDFEVTASTQMERNSSALALCNYLKVAESNQVPELVASTFLSIFSNYLCLLISCWFFALSIASTVLLNLYSYAGQSSLTEA